MENVIEKGGQPMKLPVEFTDRMKKLLGDEYNDLISSSKDQEIFEQDDIWC